jgi:hypothetical protein
LLQFQCLLLSSYALEGKILIGEILSQGAEEDTYMNLRVRN